MIQINETFSFQHQAIDELNQILAKVNDTNPNNEQRVSDIIHAFIHLKILWRYFTEALTSSLKVMIDHFYENSWFKKNQCNQTKIYKDNASENVIVMECDVDLKPFNGNIDDEEPTFWRPFKQFEGLFHHEVHEN